MWVYPLLCLFILSPCSESDKVEYDSSTIEGCERFSKTQQSIIRERRGQAYSFQETNGENIVCG